MFCQVGQGCGGRGSETLGQRRKGNKKIHTCLMYVQSTIYFLGICRCEHTIDLLTTRSHLVQDILSYSEN